MVKNPPANGEGIRDTGSIPGEGTEIPQAVWCSPNNNKNISESQIGHGYRPLGFPGGSVKHLPAVRETWV